MIFCAKHGAFEPTGTAGSGCPQCFSESVTGQYFNNPQHLVFGCAECAPLRAELAEAREQAASYRQAWQRDLAKGKELLAEAQRWRDYWKGAAKLFHMQRARVDEQLADRDRRIAELDAKLAQAAEFCNYWMAEEMERLRERDAAVAMAEKALAGDVWKRSFGAADRRIADLESSLVREACDHQSTTVNSVACASALADGLVVAERRIAELEAKLSERETGMLDDKRDIVSQALDMKEALRERDAAVARAERLEAFARATTTVSPTSRHNHTAAAWEHLIARAREALGDAVDDDPDKGVG